MNKFYCLVCGTKRSFLPLIEVSSPRKNLNKTQFIYFSCSTCSFWQLKPDLSVKELKKIYSGDYYVELAQPNANRLVNFFLNITFAKRYNDFVNSNMKKKGDLLDIGCGTGDFALQMKMYGHNVYGLDPYSSAVNLTQKKIGAKKVFHGQISLLKKKKKQFDVVTLWHVLEHLEKPKEDLFTIFSSLGKNGKLFLEVPNADSAVLRLFKNNYSWHMVPEHNHYYTNQSLRNLLTSTNFYIIKQYCPPKALTNFAQSFKKMLVDKNYNQYVVTILFFLSIPLSVIQTVIFSLMGKGEVIRVIAQKRVI